MTTSDLLARLRTMLDEASAGFWTDTEAYSAFTDGQLQLCELAVGMLKARRAESIYVDIPFILKSLLTIESSVGLPSATSSITLTGQAMELISFTYRKDNTALSIVPCFIRKSNYADAFLQGNPFATANGTTEYYVLFTPPSTITLETPVSGDYGSFAATYIKRPANITASVDPILPDEASQAVLQFAFARMMAKDGRDAEAQGAMKAFADLSQPLIME